MTIIAPPVPWVPSWNPIAVLDLELAELARRGWPVVTVTSALDVEDVVDVTVGQIVYTLRQGHHAPDRSVDVIADSPALIGPLLVALELSPDSVQCVWNGQDWVPYQP